MSIELAVSLQDSSCSHLQKVRECVQREIIFWQVSYLSLWDSCSGPGALRRAGGRRVLLRAGCICTGPGAGEFFPSLAMRFSKVESVVDRVDLNTTVTHFFT